MQNKYPTAAKYFARDACGSHIYLLMEKTTNLPPVSDKFYHMMLYRVHQAMSKIRIHNASCDIH
jgi:hypothetical protein